MLVKAVTLLSCSGDNSSQHFYYILPNILSNSLYCFTFKIFSWISCSNCSRKIVFSIIFRDTWFRLWSTIVWGHLRCLVTTVSIHIEFGDPHIVEQTYWNCHMRASPLGWAKKSKFLILAFLFAGHLQNGVRDPPKKFQIYRPINDRWQAIFVLGSVLMGKRPKNGQKLTIFKNGLKTHPKVVNASNQRWFHHFWGMLDL